MIAIKGITKVFKGEHSDVHALRGVDLRVEKGEIFGIIGMSGAGKSTLIRNINRLEEPTSGSIEIEGRDILEMPQETLRLERQKIGMIFQQFNLLSSKTIFDNVAFPLEIAKCPKADIEERVQKLLKLVGIEDKADNYPSQLSGGQKQRVAIARALANEPKLLLCDEATSALDPMTTKSILELLKTINEQLDLTIVLITHEMEVIREICHRVAIIEKGEIIEEGSVEEVFLHPKTETVKTFISHLPRHGLDVKDIPKQKDKAVVALSFNQATALEPIISKSVKKYPIEINILAGEIDQLMNTQVGKLIVQIDGEKDAVQGVMTWWKKIGVELEVIWNG